MVDYLNAYANRFSLNIIYNTRIVSVGVVEKEGTLPPIRGEKGQGGRIGEGKQPQGIFTIRDQNGLYHICRYIVIKICIQCVWVSDTFNRKK